MTSGVDLGWLRAELFYDYSLALGSTSDIVHALLLDALVMELPSLDELVARLARNAVEVQRVWNRAYASEMETFHFPDSGEPWALELVKATAPVRLAVRTFQIEASVLLTGSFEQGFELKAVPLNLAYTVWQGVKYTKQSRIAVTVEQCPGRNSSSLIVNGGTHAGLRQSEHADQ